MSSLAVLLFAVVLISCNGIGSATTITIHPQNYDGVIPTSFKITCAPQVSPGVCPRKILAIQVSRNGSRPLVTLQHQSEISYNRLLRSNIEAEGRIGKTLDESRLTVTFSDVLKEDSGLYSCAVIYMDDWGNLQRETATHNFTVEGQDSHDLIRYLMGRLVSMETAIQNQQNQLESTLRDQQTTLQNQQAQMEKQEIRISELDDKTTRYIEKDSRKSAFLVAYHNHVSLSKGQVLNFQKVIENIGGDYNVTNGIYTAPVDGLYVFHLYALVYGVGDKNVQISIIANSKQVGRLMAYDTEYYDQSSVSAVVNLKAGDLVKCKVDYISGAGHRLHSFPYSGFTGHLITVL